MLRRHMATHSAHPTPGPSRRGAGSGAGTGAGAGAGAAATSRGIAIKSAVSETSCILNWIVEGKGEEFLI